MMATPAVPAEGEISAAGWWPSLPVGADSEGHIETCVSLGKQCRWREIIDLAATHDPRCANPRLAYFRAYALWLLSRHEAARGVLLKAQVRHPQDDSLLQLQRQVAEWQWLVRQLRLDALNGHDENELILEMLGPQHLRDFSLQYGNGEIAELCCLPHFLNDEQWYAWLTRQFDLDDQLVFAVVHPVHGFVGSVSLILQGDCGMVYYWIGEAHRRKGYAARAVTILLDAAVRLWGLRDCYAKVFRHNAPSRQLLCKLGFTALDVAVKPPNDDECIYWWARDARQVSMTVLSQFLSAIDSEVELFTPVLTAPGCI